MSDPENDRLFISGVILAAGTSARMGQPKQLLAVRGRPLLQHVIDEAARSSVDELVVVLGHRADEIESALQMPPRARTVINAAYERGMSTSLVAGLRAADTRATAACVLLGDQPAVTASIIDAVISRYRSGGAPIVRPVWTDVNGKPVPGHPVIVARGIWRYAEDLRGDEGLRGLIAAHPEWLHEVAMDAAPLADIDTPEDYERALSDDG